MKVKISNNYSETRNISSDAPQRLLGLLLFVIFRNSLLNDIKSEIKLFSSDVKLFGQKKQHTWISINSMCCMSVFHMLVK